MRTLCLLMLCWCGGLASPQSAVEWTSLFDGKTLKGWVPRGGGVWSVEDGTILGLTGTGEYS